MKQTFRNIVQTRIFDASLTFLLFIIITLGIDFATEGTFSFLTICADVALSLAAAGIVFIGANRPKLPAKVIKQRSEHFAVAGKFTIGLLLFVVFIILYITN